MTTDTKNSAVETRTHEEQIRLKRERLAELNAELRKSETALAALDSAGITDNAHPARAMIWEQFESARQRRDALGAQIVREEQSQRTNALVSPLIAAFGTVKVKSTESVKGAVNLLDVDAKIASLVSEGEALADKLTYFKALKAAVAKAKIPEDFLADFRPIHPEPKEDGTLAIRVASRMGGGTRVGRGPEKVLAQTDHADIADLTGKVIGGSEADYGSWTALFNAVVKPADQATADRLTKTAKGDKRSVSMRAEMIKYFGLTVESLGDQSEGDDQDADEDQDAA